MPLSRIRSSLLVLCTVPLLLSGCGNSPLKIDMPEEQPNFIRTLTQSVRTADAWGTGADHWVLMGVNGHLSTFDGSTWRLQNPPLPWGMRAMWGFAPDDIIVVGFKGQVFRHDGEDYVSVPSGVEDDLKDVWGPGPQEIYAVGTNGTILRHDGSRWIREVSGTERTLFGVHGVDGHVFAVGDAGLVLHKAPGAGWTEMRSSGGRLLSVWAVSPTSVYAVGEEGHGVRYDRTEWVDLQTDGLGELWHVVAVSDIEVWVSGGPEKVDGRAARWNGSSWTPVEGDRWRAVYALGAGAQPAAVVLAGDGSGFVREGSAEWDVWDTGLDFTGVSTLAGFSDDDYYQFDTFGPDLHFNGSEWVVLQNDPIIARDAWADVVAGDLYVASTDFNILRVRDEVYSQAYVSPRIRSFSSIWGSGDQLFAGGEEGFMAHYDGAAWTETQLTTRASNRFIQDIEGTGPNDVYAVSKGRVHHFNGSEWSEIGLWDDTYFLNRIALRGPDDVFVLGSQDVGTSSFRNVLLHWDGSEWDEFLQRGASESWADIAFDTDGRGVLVGTAFGSDPGGVIYQFVGQAFNRELAGPDIGGFDGVWISPDETVYPYEQLVWKENPEATP